MAKLKVLTANPNAITFSSKEFKEVSVGRHKHPSFFKEESNCVLPIHKIGDEIEIPDEAFAKSDSGRYYLVGVSSIDQLKRREIQLGIAIKTKQIAILEKD